MSETVLAPTWEAGHDEVEPASLPLLGKQLHQVQAQLDDCEKLVEFLLVVPSQVVVPDYVQVCVFLAHDNKWRVSLPFWLSSKGQFGH